MSFQIIDLQNHLWKKLLDIIPNSNKDIFYTSELLNVFQETIYKKNEILAAIYYKGEKIIFYPFVKRSFNINFKFKDITSIYGRSGIITNVDKADKVINDFHSNLLEYVKNENIITSFDRYHPLLQNNKFSSNKTEVNMIQNFIILDLNKNFLEIEKKFEYRHKKSISKAEKSGVKVFFEKNLDHLDNFINIYTKMLNFQKADKFYYFEKNFYINLFKYIKENFFFSYAVLDNKIISCELILHNNFYAHSYLGASLIEYRHKCPNHILKSKTIQKLIDIKCKYYLIGGGLADNDGIYQYKKGFAPNGVYPSFIGKTIHDNTLYNNIKTNYKNKVNLLKLQFYED
jgi:hypothetical protein